MRKGKNKQKNKWGGDPCVPKVIDGDTVEVRLTHPLPAPLGPVLRLRIRGVDCPELHTPACDAELQAALRAQAFTTEWVLRESVHNGLFVSLCGWDKYGGRVLGDLQQGDGDGTTTTTTLAAALIDAGHAVAYTGSGPRRKWCV